MLRTCVGLLALLLTAGHARPASADVVDAGPSGFTVRTVVEIAAPAASVYTTLTTRVGDWWNPAHSWSGDARNLSIDARPGGCLCERLPGGPGNGVQHMTVISADAGKMLRLSGGLGPLQAMAVSAVWNWTLKEANGVTTVEATYAVGGYAKDGLAALAAIVDQVTGEQVKRLKSYVERSSSSDRDPSTGRSAVPPG